MFKYKIHRRNSNGSRLLRGTDINISPQIQETTAIWRMNQNKRPKNLIREFGSCNGTTYPTVALNCTNYSKSRLAG